MQVFCALTAVVWLAVSPAAWAVRGANFVQSPQAAWGSDVALVSLRRLQALGADTVALVPFMRQSSPAACDLAWDQHYNLARIEAAMRQAENAGLRVILKPQILVNGHWAGDIAPGDAAGWACWFNAYAALIKDLAGLAEARRATGLVVGTELKRTELRPEWRTLLSDVRKRYGGTLSYVFHDRVDVMRFPALDALDSVGLSLYPRLGETAAEAFRGTAWQRYGLRRWAAALSKPVWFAEVGVPSRQGAGKTPWQWQADADPAALADPGFQAEALANWLAALRGDWHQGVLIWDWQSDPNGGGVRNTDFTPQNKPAEAVLRCFWQDEGMPECAP